MRVRYRSTIESHLLCNIDRALKDEHGEQAISGCSALIILDDHLEDIIPRVIKSIPPRTNGIILQVGVKRKTTGCSYRGTRSCKSHDDAVVLLSRRKY